jgi:CRP/FNR family transcriptional regulator, cyclic AMP receptor protein
MSSRRHPRLSTQSPRWDDNRRVRIGGLLSAWGRLRESSVQQLSSGGSTFALKVGYLSAIDVFRDLPRSEIERLAETTTMIKVVRGQVIYRPGEYNAALFLLKKGRVQIVRQSADGRRLILATLGPETFFGEMALIGQRFPQDSTAEALDEALVCVLHRRDLERLILDYPRVGLRLLEQISARLLETELIVEDFAFKSVPARLAGVLLRLVETAQDRTVEASHQELADMVATYRATATLTLNQFQDQGLVELGRRSVRIVDPRGLEAIAEA